MNTTTSYTAEVGTFSQTEGKLDFDEADLRIPLVATTYIGRAASIEDQSFCDGGILAELRHPNILGGALSFIERPSYNGKKIIIPNDPKGFSRWISREHGILEFKAEFSYQHLSKSRMTTTLWTDEDGIVDEVQNHGDILNLQFPGTRQKRVDRYLLLGGIQDSKRIEDRFPYFSYYVLISKSDIPA